MVFFAHGAFEWENGFTVMATVKTTIIAEIQQQHALPSSSF
jgi:hypothetical protein